jgi:hypothetical protein
MSGYDDDDDEMFEEYQRYVIANPGIPEDYETWLQSQPLGNRRRPKKQRPKKFTDYGD